MKTCHKVLLVLEVVISFAPLTLLWAIGVLLLAPLMLAPALYPPLALASWPSVAVVLWLGCGLCGLVTVVRLLDRLLGSRRPMTRPWLVLAGAAAGCAAVLPLLPLAAEPWAALAIGAPLAATAHVFYLSRRILFPRSAREGLLT